MEDDLGSTPYDLSLSWNHSNTILKVIFLRGKKNIEFTQFPIYSFFR